jgi:chloride channel protein, CIC family
MKKAFPFRKYMGVPRLRTREPFFRYLEKWILLSTILGLLTGIVVALFDYATNLTLWTFFSELFAQNMLLIFPFVALALLFGGFVLSRSAEPMGSGTDEVVKAYNQDDGRMDLRSFPGKMLAAMATIGFGGSAGQEGPSVYAGGVVGAWLWNKLKHVGVTDRDRRILIMAGAAAGIGAIFKAPLTGIIFALEAPFKDDLAHDALIPSLVAAVSSYLTLIAVNGSRPLFAFPGIVSLNLVDIGASALLALIVGLCALGFIFVYRSVRRILDGFSNRFYVKALLAAAGISAVGMLSVLLFHRPYPLGISYDLINLSLTPNTAATTLLGLFLMKLVATSLTLGSTGVGGIFIPQIVMGAALGGFFGQIFFPSHVDLFVAVGMASFLAAGYKTPLASVAFVAETTTGPGYLIPSLIAAAVSYSVSGEASVSEHQKLRDEIDISAIVHMKAKDLMTKTVIAVPAELSILDFVEEYLFTYQHKRFPVVDANGLVGVIAGANVKAIPKEKWFKVKVADVCAKAVTTAYPDSDVQDILDLMYTKKIGRVPIVDRAKPRRIVGIISKTDIMRAVELERLGT